MFLEQISVGSACVRGLARGATSLVRRLTVISRVDDEVDKDEFFCVWRNREVFEYSLLGWVDRSRC